MRKWLGQTFLRLNGWRLDGERPPYSKCVVIACPHTSNWDLAYMLAAAWVYEVPLKWLGKREIFRAPFGGLMRRVGGIPVDRSKNNSLVDQIVTLFATSDEDILLVVPPSGTRSRREYWKSGFYHMAHGAGVPVVPGFLDYAGKRAGFGKGIVVTGDIVKDMDVFRAFYADKRGRYPENETRIRLRGEDDVESAEHAN
jgi:1-acyl-sn-glycerol-3-phosphate acyltransferase